MRGLLNGLQHIGFFYGWDFIFNYKWLTYIFYNYPPLYTTILSILPLIVRWTKNNHDETWSTHIKQYSILVKHGQTKGPFTNAKILYVGWNQPPQNQRLHDIKTTT